MICGNRSIIVVYIEYFNLCYVRHYWLATFWPVGVEGLYYFQEGSFLIGTLAKPRLQGAELRLQQHFRWVQLRWDTEPLSSMLGRHLRRKLLHKVSPLFPYSSS